MGVGEGGGLGGGEGVTQQFLKKPFIDSLR